MFQRLIISSGSAISPWHSSEANMTIAASQRIIRILGCNSGYLRSTIKCLVSKTTSDILSAYEDYKDVNTNKIKYKERMNICIFLE